MKRVLLALAIFTAVLIGGSASPAAAAEPRTPSRLAGSISAQLSTGPFVIFNSRSGWCLAQDFAGGIVAVQFTCRQFIADNQLWLVKYIDFGWYTITNLESDQCLDQDTRNGVSYQTVQAWPCNGGFNQLWTPTSDGRWVNGLSYDYLDQDYSGGVPHNGVMAWPTLTDSNQQWYVRFA